MKRKIGITYDIKDDWIKSESDPADASAEFDKPITINKVVESIESYGNTVVRIGNIHRLLERINDLDVDIVFNLCEGMIGRNRESQVPMLLELKGIPYVGADALSQGITLDKIFAKKMFIAEGIPTAKYFSATYTDNLEKLNTIGYPLIAKTRHEGSSKGISKDSKVYDLAGLNRQVELINKRYNQPALVEQFISGKEFTVAVLGNKKPVAMPIVQVSINGNLELGGEFYTNNRIYSSAIKYVCPAKISPELTAKVQDLAVKAFQCVECRDLARVDFRVDEKNNPYVLEINPLPSLDLEDAFNIFPQVLGSDYAGVINHVINLGLERYGLIKNYEESDHPFKKQLETVR